MQEPRVVGIAIGLILIVLGVWLGKSPVAGDKKKGRVFLYVTLIYMGCWFVLQHAFFGFSGTWTWPGVQRVVLGLFFEGPVVITIISSVFFAFGSRAPGYAVTLLSITALQMLGKSS